VVEYTRGDLELEAHFDPRGDGSLGNVVVGLA
jgi:hypothetical protein